MWRASLTPGVHAVDPVGSRSFYFSQEPPVSSQWLIAVSSQANSQAVSTPLQEPPDDDGKPLSGKRQ